MVHVRLYVHWRKVFIVQWKHEADVAFLVQVGGRARVRVAHGGSPAQCGAQ